MERKELIHSKVLAYFFNPKGNHNLGDKFIRKFFQQVFNINDLNFDDFKVSVEIPYRIDIFLLNRKDKYAVVIENKIDSDIHSSGEFETQLEKYKTNIEADYSDQSGYRKKYILLSPTGNESKEDRWESLSYKEIVKIFKAVLDEKIDDVVKDFINSYIEILEKGITEMNSEIKEKYQTIYNENKEAIDFIISNIDDEQLLIVNELKKLYSTIKENNSTNFIYPINPKETKYISFRTSGLNKYFKDNDACFYANLPNFHLLLQYSKNTKKEAEEYCEMLKINGFEGIKLYTEVAVMAQLDIESNYTEELNRIIENILKLENNN